MKVAVIGTGIMGAAMAGNLVAAGHDVSVWSRTSSLAMSLVSRLIRTTPGLAITGSATVS